MSLTSFLLFFSYAGELLSHKLRSLLALQARQLQRSFLLHRGFTLSTGFSSGRSNPTVFLVGVFLLPSYLLS